MNAFFSQHLVVGCVAVLMYTNLFLIKRNTRRFKTNRTNIKMPWHEFVKSVNIKNLLFSSMTNEMPSITHVIPITMNKRRYSVKLKFRNKKKSDATRYYFLWIVDARWGKNIWIWLYNNSLPLEPFFEHNKSILHFFGIFTKLFKIPSGKKFWL